MIAKPIKISICIPQYGRSRYLLKVLESIRQQTHPNVEVIVSDDCSKDDTATVIPKYLEGSGLDYKFVRQERNIGYDANLRMSLSLGTGDYLFILGNDDALAYPDALKDLAADIARFKSPSLVLANFRAWTDEDNKEPVRRVQSTRLVEGGPESALRVYRSFSFVGGIAFRRNSFHVHNSDIFDGSIFVQVFLATRIIASGGNLLMSDRVLVAKDVTVDGQPGNSYKDVLRMTKKPVRPDSQGLGSICRVAAEGILPFVDEARKDEALMHLYRPLLTYTYPYWLYAHRKEGFFRAAAAMALGCYPPILLKPITHRASVTLRLMPYYIVATAAGWIVPTAVLDKVKDWGYRRSKRL